MEDDKDKINTEKTLTYDDIASKIDPNITGMFNKLMEEFAKQVVSCKEEVIKEMLDKGIKEENIRYTEKIFFDDENSTLNYECIPLYPGFKKE